MASNAMEITLKLVVDGCSKKVLYAEAKKDFIDFLVGLLQVPIGSIATLLDGNGLQMWGSVGRVLQSVSIMEPCHFHSPNVKEFLLKPKVYRVSHGDPLLLQEFDCWKNRGKTYGEGYVKDNYNYMVMDNLMVSPMPSIPVFDLLERYHIKDIGLLEEKTVQIDLSKGLELVKASMVSNTVLTDVFIPKKPNASS